MLRNSEMVSPQGLDAVVWAAKRDLRHRVAQHSGGDRVSLGMVGVQEALWPGRADHNQGQHFIPD
jgi:hypothetical protein